MQSMRGRRLKADVHRHDGPDMMTARHLSDRHEPVCRVVCPQVPTRWPDTADSRHGMSNEKRIFSIDCCSLIVGNVLRNNFIRPLCWLSGHCDGALDVG